MWNIYELEIFLSKIGNSVVIGLFLGFLVKMTWTKSNEKKREVKFINKKETRLVLKQFQNYTREYIVNLGRQAIRSGLSKVLVDPVVSLDGKSYEKSVINQYIEINKVLPSGERAFNVKLYDNRALKDFIEKCYEVYNIRRRII